jgi:branched-chain amino acid aminotransferase
MAAGTAAALVPIRSITRRISPSSPQSLATTAKDHKRVSFKDGEETITYIPDGVEDAGEMCLRLLTQLKAIQLGKAEDTFGWCFAVTEDDTKAVATGKVPNGAEPTVDQLD